MADFQDYENCTNDYCVSEEDYIDLMFDHIMPTSAECILIAMHTIVFTVGLVGNILVCLAVHRNHSMRTVTNYFIVNLAIADLLVIIICLPPTVVWDVTETWFLGLELCKIVPYLQNVSVSVSILTLTFISIDRWGAVVRPLKFRSTTGRAKTAIIIIWLASLGFDIPDLLVLQIVDPEHKANTVYFTQCAPSWSVESQTIFTLIKFILLYTGPLLFMTIAYWQIVRVLWRSNIPGHNMSTRTMDSEFSSPGTGNAEGQLRSRRKAAKMLVAVVLMFAICYFPVHLLSLLRYTMKLPANEVTNILSCLAHWLCYANSAINPIIYNFFSGKYRKEFKKTFCCPTMNRRQTMDRKRSINHSRGCRSNVTIRSFRTTSNCNNHHPSTEVIPLSAVANAPPETEVFLRNENIDSRVRL